MSTTKRRPQARLVIAAAVATATAVAAANGGQTMTAAGAVSHYCVQRAPSAITIDGRLDELGWQMAEQINGFERILNDYGRIERATRAKMLWDDDALYFGFANTDPDIWAICDAEDDPMWAEEVVEVFIDPDGDGRNYLELEVNPLNVWVDLRIHSAVPSFDGSVDWDIAGLRSAVQVHGTVNDSLDVDTGWTVEFAIPWAAMADSIDGGARPSAGDEWRLNLYRIERKGGRALKARIDALQAEAQPLTDQIGALVSTAGGPRRPEAELSRGTRRQLKALRERLEPIRIAREPLDRRYEETTEYTAWSATWRQGFHDPTRFGVVRFVQ